MGRIPLLLFNFGEKLVSMAHDSVQFLFKMVSQCKVEVMSQLSATMQCHRPTSIATVADDCTRALAAQTVKNGTDKHQFSTSQQDP